jgi:hypothetical protein
MLHMEPHAVYQERKLEANKGMRNAAGAAKASQIIMSSMFLTSAKL